MTDRDKTEEQLLSSIRKNKPVASATSRKTPAKKAAVRKTTDTGPKRKPAAESSQGSAYQSGRRVWPD